MILRDVAEKTGLDPSTISRVSNSKYAQTRWGTFPLRHFFSDAYVTESGEELSTRQIKAALRDIIDGEDKRRPLSDDALKEELARRGFPIARPDDDAIEQREKYHFDGQDHKFGVHALLSAVGGTDGTVRVQLSRSDALGL